MRRRFGQQHRCFDCARRFWDQGLGTLSTACCLRLLPGVALKQSFHEGTRRCRDVCHVKRVMDFTGGQSRGSLSNPARLQRRALLRGAPPKAQPMRSKGLGAASLNEMLGSEDEVNA